VQFDNFPTRHNHGLALRQSLVKRIPAGAVGGLVEPI
jgi:hypothetical protein